jgi:transcriptional regulator with XRE-family HTH domain
MHVGKNISKIRELLGIKQESLALILKISQQTVSKIEQTANLREQTVERIAKALNVSPNMLLQYNEQLLIDFIKGTVKQDIQIDSIGHLLLLEKIIELYERLLKAKQETIR